MASQGWVNLLNAGSPWQTSNGTALSASASTATISPQAPTTQDFMLPTQYNGLQWYAGMTLKVEARGTFNSGSTTSNATVFLAIGVSGTLGTTLCTTGALTLGTGSLTGLTWRLGAIVRVLAIGSTGNTLSAGGELILPTAVGNNTGTVGTANATYMGMSETTTAFSTYTLDSCIGLRGTLSAAFGAIQCNQFLVYQTA